jgi:hypothetical protein
MTFWYLGVGASNKNEECGRIDILGTIRKPPHKVNSRVEY